MRIGWDIGLCLEKEVDEQWRREGCFLADEGESFAVQWEAR